MRKLLKNDRYWVLTVHSTLNLFAAAEVRKDVSRRFQIASKRDVRSPKLFYLAVGFKSEKLVGRCQIAYRLTKKWKISRSTMI
ncbi:unnamed protein product [Rotaria sp. Silwood1]|nr:unnamed protein product [Rotaria sp. Silwood1]CAF1649513.1 unnamed protein product [Rotaria sp. Silwood1]